MEALDVENGEYHVLYTLEGRVVLTSDPVDFVAVANEVLRREWNSRWPKRPKWLSRRIHGEHPPQI
jgi:hypothetical protein